MSKVNNEWGFSMVELIIVIAIMGIIGALLVPQFFRMTGKARVATDISSIKTIQRQIDCYQAAFAKSPGNTPQTIMSELVTQQYIDNMYVSDTGNLAVTTPGAQMIFDVAAHQVRLKVSTEQYNLFLGQPESLVWLTY